MILSDVPARSARVGIGGAPGRLLTTWKSAKAGVGLGGAPVPFSALIARPPSSL